jgi:hypothetical protein
MNCALCRKRSCYLHTTQTRISSEQVDVKDSVNSGKINIWGNVPTIEQFSCRHSATACRFSFQKCYLRRLLYKWRRRGGLKQTITVEGSRASLWKPYNIKQLYSEKMVI